MSNWDKAAQAAKESGGKFVKLKGDKDSVVAALLDEPYTHWQGYDKATEKYFEVTEEQKKNGTAAQRAAGPKFKMNLYVPKEGRVMILEMNSQSFEGMLTAYNKYGAEKVMFEIIRHGGKGDTKTYFGFMPDREITDTDRAAIKALPLHDLGASKEDDGEGATTIGSKGTKPEPAKKADAPTAAPAASLTLDEADAAALLARLKARTAEQRAVFTEKYAIKKARDLPKAKLAEVQAWLTTLENPAAAADEDDL